MVINFIIHLRHTLPETEETRKHMLSRYVSSICPALLLGKLMGKKIIFIECMFNVDEPTLTGKLAYKFSDLFIVQWEDMLKVYPKAVLGGRVF